MPEPRDPLLKVLFLFFVVYSDDTVMTRVFDKGHRQARARDP
jgi:hypothetical protein